MSFHKIAMKYLAFCKPFGVLSQFTDSKGRDTLKNYIQDKQVYPVGRLDYRSEGLLILSDDGVFIQRMSDPRFNHPKTYLAQVEGTATPTNIERLNTELLIPGFQTKIVQATIVAPPDIFPRTIPVRDYHPTTWLQITLTEGKKHQVRRLTAAVGCPTLRLIRIAIGSISLGNQKPGEWRYLSNSELKQVRMELGIR